MLTNVRLLALAGCTLIAGCARAQPVELGNIDFPNSGSTEAQPAFIRGLAALHNFWYDEALKSFREAERIDPDFAMAYWGEAMAYNHTLWGREDFDAARDALTRLDPSYEGRLAKAGTERERRFLQAVEILYGVGDKDTRDREYRTAMEAFFRDFPSDVDVACFYSLSILGTIEYGADSRGQVRAAAILEPFFLAHRRHPGVLHYLIHAYDDPVHAPLALRQAEIYADVAPASDHALHMPSHIFVQLGRWDDAARSDEAAFAARMALMEREGHGPDQMKFHSLNWMQYEYLQMGRYKMAAEKLAIAESTANQTDAPAVHLNYALMKARQIIETGAWDQADELSDMAAKLASDGTKANVLLVRAISAVKLGDLEVARKVADQLREMRDAAFADSDRRLADALTVSIDEIEGLLLISGRSIEDALARLAKAADIEESLGFPSGPPSRPIKPAVELYAEALLDQGRPERAVAQFERALERVPNRALSLNGLIHAAEAAGMSETEARAKDLLALLWHDADSELTEGNQAGNTQ